MIKLTAVALLLFCVAGTVAAQQAASGDKIAKYVYWQDAKVNSGKYSVFAKQVAEFRDAAASAAPDSYWIVGSPVTGDNSTLSFITFQDSMAGVESFMNAMDKAGQAVMAKDASWEQEDAEASSGSYSALAKYNAELSLRPETVSLADTAYWASEVFELRPGCGHQFNEAVKTVMELHKKAGDHAHWMLYDLMSGPSLPAALFVVPMKSLAEEDEEPPAAAKELFQSPPVQAMLSSVSKECIAHISSSYHKVQPGLSRPMPALVSANPSFWTVKEETVSTVPMKMKKSKKKKM
jgi:hypothetical protein